MRRALLLLLWALALCAEASGDEPEEESWESRRALYLAVLSDSQEERAAAAERCVRLLGSDDGEFRDTAWNLLVLLDEDALPALRVAIEDSDDRSAASACWLACEMSESAAARLVPSLLIALKRDSWRVRLHAACSLLVTTDSAAAATTVRALLASDDPKRLHIVGIMIQGIERRRSMLVDAIKVALQRATGEARAALCGALATAEGADAWTTIRGPLLSALRSTREATVAEAKRSLQIVGAVALEDVRKELQSRKSHVRRNACQALGALGSEEATASLRNIRDSDPEQEVRRAASEAMHAIELATGGAPFTGPPSGSVIGLGGGAATKKKQEKEKTSEEEK